MPVWIRFNLKISCQKGNEGDGHRVIHEDIKRSTAKNYLRMQLAQTLEVAIRHANPNPNPNPS